MLLVTSWATRVHLILYLAVHQTKYIMERQMLKQVQVQLHPPEQPHWHGDIKKLWLSIGVFIVNFEKIPHLFLVFHFWIWGSVTGCIYQQRPKYRQIKIAKHVSTGTSYVIFTKQVKVQHEKKPVSNLRSIQIAGFEETSTKFIGIFVP